MSGNDEAKRRAELRAKQQEDQGRAEMREVIKETEGLCGDAFDVMTRKLSIEPPDDLEALEMDGLHMLYLKGMMTQMPKPKSVIGGMLQMRVVDNYLYQRLVPGFLKQRGIKLNEEELAELNQPVSAEFHVVPVSREYVEKFFKESTCSDDKCKKCPINVACESQKKNLDEVKEMLGEKDETGGIELHGPELN